MAISGPTTSEIYKHHVWQTNQRAVCKPVDQAESGLLPLLKPLELKHASLTGEIRTGCHVIHRIWRIWTPCFCWVFDCDLRSVSCRSDLCLRKCLSNHLLSSHRTCLNPKPFLWPPTPPPLHLHLLAHTLKPGWRCNLVLSCSHSQSHFGSPARPLSPAAAAADPSPLMLANVDVCSGIQEQGSCVWILSV